MSLGSGISRQRLRFEKGTLVDVVGAARGDPRRLEAEIRCPQCPYRLDFFFRFNPFAPSDLNNRSDLNNQSGPSEFDTNSKPPT
jgi:hypothetical protein